MIVADRGELDGDWSDPAQVQGALFAIVETLRRARPALDPHFVVVLSTFTVEQPAALYLPFANDVRGIGWRHLEPAEVFRFAPGRLDGVLFLNGVRLAERPETEALFLQELGHRWGVYVRLDGPDPTRLLGRDCAHWSALVRRAGSAMEGNPWVEVAPGRFRAEVPDAIGYSDAERYLMGLLPAAAVGPVAWVSDAGWPCFEAARGGVPNPRWAAPTWRTGAPVEVDGALSSVPWDAVVAHEGPRVPDASAARRRWSALFVLAARAVDDPTAAVAVVDRVRLRWSARFAAATATADGDRLELVTTTAAAALDPAPGAVGFGGRCLDAVDCAADWPRCVGTATGDRFCTARCAAHADCGAGACCVPIGAGDAVCAPAMDPCPAVDAPDGSVDAAPAVDAALDGPPLDGSPLDGGAGRPAPAGCGVAPAPARDGAGGLLAALVLIGWRRRARRPDEKNTHPPKRPPIGCEPPR